MYQSVINKIALSFNKAKDTVYSNIKSVINKFSLYSCVIIKRKVTDLSLATENDVGRMMMAIKTGI